MERGKGKEGKEVMGWITFMPVVTDSLLSHFGCKLCDTLPL